MKTLLIYMGEDQYSHELALHKHVSNCGGAPGAATIADYITQYIAHFKTKRCSKLHIVVIDVTDNVVTVERDEWMEHPLKQKIIINKVAKEDTPKKATPVVIQNPPLGFWDLPQTAIWAAAANDNLPTTAT